MIHRRLAPLCMSLGLCLGLVASPLASAAHGKYDLKVQLETLMKWWPGEYDNHEQIVRQSGGGLSPLTDRPFYRVHSRYERVVGSPLGENVLSVVDYRDDDPAKVLRARTYVLSVDEAAGALRLTQYAPKTAGSSELVPLSPSCDLLMQFVGAQFEGSVSPKACKVDGKPVEFGLVVGPRFTWFREQPGHAWFEQARARRFTCIVQDSADGDMRKTKFLKTIRLHDQGGEADIAWPDGRTLTFTIHSRAFTSPPDREYPLFRIHEKGKDVPIAYAYAVDDAGRFGLNLGWFYTRCYAEGEDMGMDAAYK
ncbi:MAG: hypothetical protein IT483_04035 [Gammaproteobacteria bacterium]|nr:hypothetical protein [Gammaproteobacteria bacterium]